MRVRRSITVAYLLAVAWNLVLPLVTIRPDRSFWPLFTSIDKNERGCGAFVLVGVCAALVFAYLAVRSLANTTSVSFRHGKLVCRTGPLVPRKVFEHDAVDITGFVAEPGKDKGEGFVVSLVTRTGHRVRLPIDLDGLALLVRGFTDRTYFLAPYEHAAFVAARLDDALDLVRHEGGRYRIAPGAEPDVREPLAAGDDEQDGAPIEDARLRP